jgi:hypothetical protein
MDLADRTGTADFQPCMARFTDDTKRLHKVSQSGIEVGGAHGR